MDIKKATELKEQFVSLCKQLRTVEFELYKVTNTPKPDKATIAANRKKAKTLKYKTENGLSIQDLRTAGNKVKVIHIRNTVVLIPKTTHDGELRYHLELTMPVNSFMRKSYTFEPRGGATHIQVTTPDGAIFMGSSICHEQDTFDYKMGVKLALEQFTDEAIAKMMKDHKSAVSVE